MSATCIICKKAVRPRAENKAFPFCSERCRQVDLGKWLNEEYRVPAEEADDDVESGMNAPDEDAVQRAHKGREH